MPKLKNYNNSVAREYYSRALNIQINPEYSDKKMIVKAAILRIAADAAENGGVFPLKRMENGKSRGSAVPAWSKILRLARECHPGNRPEGWLREMQRELGIKISGGTPQTGVLTATLVPPEKEELK